MSTKQPYITLAEILMDIEGELRLLNLWESQSPSLEALASREPFAVDTLTFPQWLQFIFIPRLYALIEQEQKLPNVSGIKPMADHYFQALPHLYAKPLIAHLEKIDSVLTGK